MYLLLVCATVLPGILAQVTCPGLGDFNPTGPFEGWPDPTCPGNPGLDLIYTMYSQNGIIGQDFDRNTIPSNFDPALNTIFVVHGWSGDGSSGWQHRFKDELLDNNFDYNCVVVGWGGPEGAEDLNYLRSASDTRTVGAETAEVMMNLVQSGGGDVSRMHISGHSLGAQVTGHAGRWASNAGFKPARCTGLDPAGPFFINNTDRTVGIYNDCADFVDIIHTDQSLGSTPNPGASDVYLGHQDYFPNGGAEQPGCGGNNCDHGRVTDFFEASLTNGCFDATAVCDNSADMPASCSPCGLQCGRMGFFAAPGPLGRFYLITSGFGDYC